MDEEDESVMRGLRGPLYVPTSIYAIDKEQSRARQSGMVTDGTRMEFEQCSSVRVPS